MKRLVPFLFIFLSLLSSKASGQWTAITNAPGTTVTYGTVNVSVSQSGATTGGGCGGYYWTPGTGSSYTFTFSVAVPAVSFTCDALNYGESITFYVNGSVVPLNSCNLDPTPFVNSCSNGNCNIVGNTLVHNIVGQWTCGGVMTFYGAITSVQVVQTVGGSGTTYDVDFAQPGTSVPGPGGTLVAAANTVSCGGTLNLTASGMTGVTSYSWSGPNGFTSTQQNPSIPNAGPQHNGVYTVTAQTSCGPITASVTVTINTPSAPTVTSPVNYCTGQSAVPLVANGTNLLWYTVPTGGTGSTTAPTPSTTTAGTFTWYVSQTVNGCESARTPITVNVIQVPVITAGSNSPLCAGSTLLLTASPNYTGATWSWTGPNSYVNSFQNPSIGFAQPNNAGTYTVTATLGGCTSLPSSVNVVILPVPFINNATFQNPTTCNGTNGQITLGGLTANTSYSVTYSLNGVPQAPVTVTSNNFGQLVITGLGAGTYSSVMASIGNCNSNTVGPITLTGPTPPNINVTVTNSNNCNSPNGSLTISGLNAGTYTVNYSINGVPQPPATLTASGGQIVISNLSPGTYSGITVTTATTNCTSNTAGPLTISGPVAPIITVTSTDPTTCNGTDGTITIGGLTNGSSYVVNYDDNGAPQTTTQTANGTNIIINGLNAGTYSNITVTINGCVSNIAGPVILTDPSAPVATAANNGPICAGETLNLTGTSSITSSTWSWSGPNGFTSTLQNPSINGATVAASGTYTLIVSAGTCNSTVTTTVVVNPAPVVPTATSNSPVCEGNNLNLSATTTTPGVTYDWTGPYNFPNTQNPTVPGVTPAASGTYTVTVSANGCSSSNTTVVNIITKPTITATSTNPTICGGTDGTITLSGLTTGTGYVINYDKNGTPQAAINQTASGGTLTISGLNAGTYNNITASLNGCPSNIIGPITLTDPTLPPTPTAGSNSPLCAGDDLELTATTVSGADYTWTGPGFSNNTQNPTIANATTAASGTYTVVAVVNGCTSLPGTVNVTVNPAPGDPNADNNGPICEGETLNLTADLIAGVSYSWSGPGFTGTSQNESITNATPAASGMYMVVVDNGSCSDTGYTNVSVNPIPLAPTVVTPLELCQYEQVQLSAQGQNLLWYDVAVGGLGTATLSPFTGAAGSTMYYVSQSVSGCEGPRAQLEVIVKPQPVPPSVTPSYTYCQYDTSVVQLSATGQNIQWYDIAQGGTPLSGAPTPNTSVPGTYLWYATQTDNGCESDRSPVMVTVHPQPGLPGVAEVVYCQDEEPAALTATGTNLLWYTTATGGTGDPNAPVPSTATVGTTDYYVSQSENGCEGERALVRVTVNPKVTAVIITDKDTVCDSYPLSVSFGGQAPTTAVYNWNFGGADPATGTTSGPYTVNWSEPGIKTITVTVSNLNCSATASKEVVVLPTPDPRFDIQADACIGDQVRVQVAYDQMGMPGYNWNFGDAQVIEGSGYGPYTLKWNSPGQKIITMSLTNIPCPSLPYADTINIHHPVASIADISSDKVCSADSVLFTAEGGLDYQYAWSPERYFGNEPTGMSAWGVIQQTDYVTLHVTDRWGCTNSDSLLVETESCCQVYFPNAFSPNGDGKNDVFRLVTKGNHTISRFIIMDRWGRKVFETADANEAWDGTFNGEPQDIGTYSYYLKYRCGESSQVSEQQGDVILIR